jgi:hypothetical protein
MSLQFSHRYEKGFVFYDDYGISIRPRLSKKKLLIAWENIKFISPTPAVKQIENRWFTYNEIDLMVDDGLQKLDFLYFDIVIKDRHQLKMPGISLYDSALFWLEFPTINATYDEHDQPMKDQGFIHYKIKKGTLNKPLRELLDFLQVKTKYDLLCFPG